MSLIAGNNPEAKKLVSDPIKEIGLVPIDIGTAEQAKLLESLADLVRMMMIKNVWAILSIRSRATAFGGEQIWRKASHKV